MALEPRQLRAFLAIAQTGSLGRAADLLHLTQPALSRVVKRMEAQLHVQLFERRSNGMELTTFGQTLLPFATHLTEEAAMAIEELNVRLGVGRGTIRIGTVASAAIMVLPAVLDRIHRQWPHLQIQIVEAVEDRLTESLIDNDVDVVLSGALQESEEIMQVAEHSFHDRSMAIAAANHPLAQGQPLSLQDIAHAVWVMPPAAAEPRKRFDELMHSLGLAPPTVIVETRSPSTIKALVAKTHFLGWLPEPLFAAEQSAGLIRALPIDKLVLPRKFFVYRRRRNFIAPALAKFLEALRQPS
ncbi:MAG: LysR family transcriptional regulator [Steroidobacteraceae bacterium]